MRVALDTNILAYAEGVKGSARKKLTLDLCGLHRGIERSQQ
jgi:hypothetical protein